MKTIGLQAYRFSIAWPRILPTGTGAVNEKGLDYYDRLTDALLQAGIAPFCNALPLGSARRHWRMPGGWPARGRRQLILQTMPKLLRDVSAIASPIS